MWLFTSTGFYSLCAKEWNPEGIVTVRGRSRNLGQRELLLDNQQVIL